MKNLEELFSALDDALRGGKRLKELTALLAAYDGDDRKQYEKYNTEHYARNLVKINDQLEMLILCWEIHQGCLVHDHQVKGCLVRILQGEVIENIYKFSGKPEFLGSSILPAGGIAYKEGNEILHEIFNHSDRRAASIGYADQIDHPVPIHFTDLLPI